MIIDILRWLAVLAIAFAAGELMTKIKMPSILQQEPSESISAQEAVQSLHICPIPYVNISVLRCCLTQAYRLCLQV